MGECSFRPAAKKRRDTQHILQQTLSTCHCLARSCCHESEKTSWWLWKEVDLLLLENAGHEPLSPAGD